MQSSFDQKLDTRSSSPSVVSYPAETPDHFVFSARHVASEELNELQTPQFTTTLKLSARQAIRLYAEHSEELEMYWREPANNQDLSLGAQIITNACSEFRNARAGGSELAKIQSEQQEAPGFSLDRFMRKVICSTAINEAEKLDLYLSKSASWHLFKVAQAGLFAVGGTIGTMVVGIMAGLNQNFIVELALIPVVAGGVVAQRHLFRTLLAGHYREEFAKDVNKEINLRAEHARYPLPPSDAEPSR